MPPDSDLAPVSDSASASGSGDPVGALVSIDDPDTAQKRATCLHLAGGVMVEMAGANYPIFSKLIPLMTHTYSSHAEFISASKNFDDAAFSETLFPTMAVLGNVISGACVAAGAGELALNTSIKNGILAGSTQVLKQHVVESSGWMKMMRGVMFAEPYLTPVGKREYMKIMESPEYFKALNTAYDSALAGKPNPKATALAFQDLFHNMSSKSFHPRPEFPVQTIESTLAHEFGKTGKVADLNALKKFAAFTTPVLTKYLPPIDVAANAKSVYGDWQKYTAAQTPEATADALAAMSSSGLSLVGSAITAVGLNPATKKFVPRPFMLAGLALMCTGAGGSFLMDRKAKKEAAKIQ